MYAESVSDEDAEAQGSVTQRYLNVMNLDVDVTLGASNMRRQPKGTVLYRVFETKFSVLFAIHHVVYYTPCVKCTNEAPDTCIWSKSSSHNMLLGSAAQIPPSIVAPCCTQINRTN